MGFWGGRFSLEKFFHISEQAFDGATRRFKRYGTLCLLFAWVPVIGDPLTVVAGVLRVNFTLFLALVTTGKALRYLAIVFALGNPFK
jgi:membrane protein YqaA with SNARE-associated domain